MYLAHLEKYTNFLTKIAGYARQVPVDLRTDSPEPVTNIIRDSDNHIVDYKQNHF